MTAIENNRGDRGLICKDFRDMVDYSLCYTVVDLVLFRLLSFWRELSDFPNNSHPNFVSADDFACAGGMGGSEKLAEGSLANAREAQSNEEVFALSNHREHSTLKKGMAADFIK